MFLKGSRIGYIGSVAGLLLQVAIGVYSLRAGVIAGGAVTVLAGILCIFCSCPRPASVAGRGRRGSALSELRTTAGAGFRYAWAAPVILLLIGVDFFMGMSSEAFDRLKEAHFLRDIGLPAVGNLDPVVWFGIFWLVGMVLGFVATGRLIKRFEQGGRKVVTQLALRPHGHPDGDDARVRADRARPGSRSPPCSAFSSRETSPARSTRSGSTSRSETRACARPCSRSRARRMRSARPPGAGARRDRQRLGHPCRADRGRPRHRSALWLYGRAIAHQGREPELEELPATVA